MLYTGDIWNDGIFKAFVFPHSAVLRESLWPYCTPTEMKNRKKQPRTILSELQYKYRFMHKMKASFPIFNILVSVTTLLQCSVVYMGSYFFIFFSTHECQRGNKKRCLVCSGLLTTSCLRLLPDPGASFIVNLCFSQNTCPSVLCCIWPQPMSLESKRIMPFVQNLDPYCTSISVQRMFAFQKNPLSYFL